MQTEKKIPKTSTLIDVKLEAWQQFFLDTKGKGHDVALNCTNCLVAGPALKFMHFSGYLLECMAVPHPVERLEGWDKRLDKWREFSATPPSSACGCTPAGKTKRYACPHDLGLFEEKFPHPRIPDELFDATTADLERTRVIWRQMHVAIDREEQKKSPPGRDLLTQLLSHHSDDYNSDDLQSIMRRFTELENSGWLEGRWQAMCRKLEKRGWFDQGVKERLLEGKGGPIARFASAQLVFALRAHRIHGPTFFEAPTKEAAAALEKFWSRVAVMQQELKAGTFCPLCIVEGVNPAFLDACIKTAMSELNQSACLRILLALGEQSGGYFVVAEFTRRLCQKITARCGKCSMAGAMHRCPLCKMQVCGKWCYKRHPGIQKCKQAYAASKQEAAAAAGK
jgi:hypothetical protein